MFVSFRLFTRKSSTTLWSSDAENLCGGERTRRGFTLNIQVWIRCFCLQIYFSEQSSAAASQFCVVAEWFVLEQTGELKVIYESRDVSPWVRAEQCLNKLRTVLLLNLAFLATSTLLRLKVQTQSWIKDAPRPFARCQLCSSSALQTPRTSHDHSASHSTCSFKEPFLFLFSSLWKLASGCFTSMSVQSVTLRLVTELIDDGLVTSGSERRVVM